MNNLFYLLTSSAIFSASLLSLMWYAGREHRGVVQRLVHITRKRGSEHQADSVREEETAATLTTLLVWIRGKLRLSLSWETDVRDRLMSAGFRNSGAFDGYCLVRIVTPICAAILGAILAHHRGTGALLACGLSFLLPDVILRRMSRARRDRIQKSLPDTIDLLVICVDAGLGLDQGLARVSQELGVSHPEITEEFNLLGLEQRAGKPRLQAWQAMAERIGLPEVHSFAGMLMQTERFGTPITKALSTFAEGLRERRNQQAEELAAKTTVKIVFPLIFCILPSMFIVLLGPAMITLFHTFPILNH